MAYQKINKEERNRQFLLSFSSQNPNSESSPYAEESVEQNKKFLIVCEGENTEKLYFERFPVVNKSVVTVFGGYGGSKQYLVREAKKIASKGDFDEHNVWCVFDYDVKRDNAKQKQDYDNAIAMALKNGYQIAYSNDCFELWMILHYKLIQNQHHRMEYFDMLTSEWKLDSSYESLGKTVDFANKLYERLLPHQPIAMRNARNLFSIYPDSCPFHQRNPCTAVYQLVEELNQYLRR